MNTKRRGRKPIPATERVKVCSVYLNDTDKKAIIKYYGSITNSIKTEVLPKIKNNEQKPS